jgi:5-hydroxyisourate hydrolase-like protein (transthyretin family)
MRKALYIVILISLPLVQLVEVSASTSSPPIPHVRDESLTRQSTKARRNRREIVGRVLFTNTGHPVSGAQVEVRRLDARLRVVHTITNEDGSFRIEGLDAGRYQVTFTKPGVCADTGEADLRYRSNVFLEIIAEGC